MKRTLAGLAPAIGLLLGACGGDSDLPVATGKASISAINAISGSPTMSFLIEELSIATVSFRGTTAPASYDDLDYTFNFDILFAGDNALTRIASQRIDFVANQHYTLLAAGTLAAPTLVVWEAPQREFAETETVFQARFAHSSEMLRATAIDVYFALDGVAPVLGEQTATLNFGDISAAQDFESDGYVVTITTAGDPTDVLFSSEPSNISSRNDLIITPFDGDASNTGSLLVRALSTLGGVIPFDDPLALPTVQFLHAAMEMGSTDVYDDAPLTSQILVSHSYRDLTTQSPVVAGSHEYFYTPAGDTASVLLNTSFTADQGARYRIAAGGSGGVYATTNYIIDRREIDSAAKLLYFQSTNNFEFTDVYIVDAGTTIEDQAAFRSGIAALAVNAAFELAPGSYDLYVTDFQDKGILAGPVRLDVALGDVVDMVVFDTVDPAVLDIVVYP